MKQHEDSSTYDRSTHSRRTGFGRKHTPLRWLEMSFTDTGHTALSAYRARMSLETGRALSLSQALDALIKSHPFVTGS